MSTRRTAKAYLDFVFSHPHFEKLLLRHQGWVVRKLREGGKLSAEEMGKIDDIVANLRQLDTRLRGGTEISSDPPPHPYPWLHEYTKQLKEAREEKRIRAEEVLIYPRTDS